MLKLPLLKVFLVLVLLFAITSVRVQAQAAMQVKGRFLYDPKGAKVILRGVNEMFIWSSDLTGERTFPEIAKTGANVVRLVWLSSDENPKGSAANLDKIISNCIAQGMIPMPELHGATGNWSKLQQQVDYWVKPEVVAVLKKHEPYLLLNIANEVGGWEIKDEQFREAYTRAITQIRSTGLKCPLVIDGTGWGQNIDILQANGPYLIEQDPQKNLLFSVHMWWTAPDGAKTRIQNEIKESVAMNLPLIVGEFAPMGVGCKKYIDYKTIMEECLKNQIGWLAWSWGLQNNGDCALMDMTNDAQNGQFAGLVDWGLEVAVTDKYSIRNTAKKTRYFKKRNKNK
ncbi:hypothetical protein AAE02nite_36860 [Adhaeribacter aerolatus]|uniref:Glycoside hydrolase family 5 domain-containing protein n=1 Tax=Adhaeribacter aerolatus TaxID=670289 RepID=A0A512B241_9BACT|nr:cellulase family glycosylhydrolase [Adhaeribacter aerolatus]GEO06022.1 hypothetical protein AAE02nite_36860 [Adhaeribacter aerolatus]